VDSLLKRQLAQIKARALRLRSQRESGVQEDDDSCALVDAIVDTGAVTRGADFTPRPRAPRRWPWHRVAGERPDIDAILARYKTGEPRPIEVVAPGVTRTVGDHTCYVITARGEAVDPVAPLEAARFARVQAWPEHVTYGTTARAYLRRKRTPRSGANAEPAPFDPGRILFLDIETTGLAPNTYVFLCGVMYLEGGEWVTELVFARDYAEEAGLLAYIRDLMARYQTVVTYNGATFDLPFLRTRMAVHRAGTLPVMGSVDLLSTTRRVFRGILPNRRLTTVERHLRRVNRQDDIPGRYIPDAYHDFVRTGDARVMHNVLYHNRMDLFAMAVIITHLAGSAESEVNRMPPPV
jgi:uncharacterized protein YprB with RNaseH-like and TPR domain